ncbi:MAG TPA: hypothetical protein VGC76_00995 [Pyrinomonadaceae bacterium]|jgi:hypothetical protein
MTDYKQFESLSYEDFRRRAKDDTLTRHEKVGFPNSYREGREELIFEDILRKLPLLKTENKTVLEVGPGCSKLPFMLIDLCEKQRHELIFVDSPEMLAQLPDKPFIRKIEGFYPRCPGLFEEYHGRVDVFLSYSVFQMIFIESNIWEAFDRSLELLSNGGEMLIGDIPNVSKRKRFFGSERGIEFHREFTGTKEIPEVSFNNIEHGKIDDAVLLGLLARGRSQGFDVYLVPQSNDLPLANRREDILVRKP